MSESICRLLHFSDLHVKRNSKPLEITTLLSQIASSLATADVHQVDAILFTGDLIAHEKGDTSFDLKKKADEIKRSLQKFANGFEDFDMKNFLVVPGNHDVSFTEWKNRFGPFVSFINRFRNASVDNKKIKWDGEPFQTLDAKGLEGIYRIESQNLAVILLNSASKVTNRDKSRIEVSEKTLDALAGQAISLRKDRFLKIALVHNPPVIARKTGEELKTFRNSEKTIGTLADSGVGLILHGDQHECQHVAGVRVLAKNAWPVYTLGAGHILPQATGTRHFHLLTIRRSFEDNCAEVEITSFQNSGDGFSPISEQSYVLYLPVYDEARRHSRGTLHVFELPQARHECPNSLLKHLLFSYRANIFDLVLNTTQKLLEKNNPQAEIYPDHMYSLFYDSIFDIITASKQPNQSFLFRGVHHGDYLTWQRDTCCIQLLEQHNEASSKGASIERVIILTDAEIEEVRKDGESRRRFQNFCENMMKHKFMTYITREDWVKRECPTYFDRHHARRCKMPHSLSPGNIALFADADDINSVDNTKAIAFYYTVTDGLCKATLSRSEDHIESVTRYVIDLWELKEKLIGSNGKQIHLLVECKELCVDEMLDRFLLKSVPHAGARRKPASGK